MKFHVIPFHIVLIGSHQKLFLLLVCQQKRSARKSFFRNSNSSILVATISRMKRKLTLLPDYGSVKRKRISSISTTTTNSTSIFSESPISAPETDNSNDPLIPLATIERTLFQATSHTPQSRPSCSQNSIRSMEPSSILPELWTFSEWRYPNDDEWSKMSTEKQRKTWPKYARRKREIKKLKHFKWFNKDVDPMPRGVRGQFFKHK